MSTIRYASAPWLQPATWFAGLAACALAGCVREPDTLEPDPTPVRIQAVTAGPAAPPIEATGIVAARDEQRLSFKVGGLVARIAVREGDAVRRGQLLAQLDQTEIDAQLTQARQLAEKAGRDLARGEALYADQVIPLEQLENLRTQAEVTRAQYAAMRFNAHNASIIAPGDGVVLRRLVEERENVAPGQVVLVVGREDGGYVVRFAVADRQMVRIQRGDAVELRLDAWPAETFRASVTQVASAADPATGLFPIQALIEPNGRRLVSGLLGRVRLVPTPGEPTLPHVPLAAVIEGHGQRAAVFLADGGVARRREIEVAFITAESVAVRAGLSVGERVITAGAPYLDDGDPVVVVP